MDPYRSTAPSGSHTHQNTQNSQRQEPETGSLSRLLFTEVENNSKNGGQQFISRVRLGEIVNERTVKEQLDKSDKKKTKTIKIRNMFQTLTLWRSPPPPQVDNLENARKICGNPSFKQIMAILVLIDRPTKIKSFLEHEISDAALPFDFDLHKVKAIECFKGWKDLTISRFLVHQSTVRPYFFKKIDKNIKRPITLGKLTLPFSSFAKSQHKGATSDIYQVDIHAEQRDFGDLSRSGRFIIKRLHGNSHRRRCSFLREFAVLRRFSNNAHPHIVSLLVAYEYNGSFNFMFPEAKSTLAEFWTCSDIFPSKHGGRHLLLWMIQQCQGLAAGLSQLHRHETLSGESLLNRSSGLTMKENQSNSIESKMAFEIYGWHGDIKPENILWFPGPGEEFGILKIADFGLTQFSINLRSYRKPLGYSPTYSAPEFSPTNPPNLINALCDVWALGCVYLEALTWAVGGSALHGELIQRKKVSDPGFFGQSSGQGYVTDTFFISAGPNVKPVVTEFIAELYNNERCTELCRKVLNIVKKDMLVVIEGELISSRKWANCIAVDLSNLLNEQRLVQ